MWISVKSEETRLAGTKGSHVRSKGRLGRQIVEGLSACLLSWKTEALTFLPTMHSHSGNYVIAYESIQLMRLGPLKHEAKICVCIRIFSTVFACMTWEEQGKQKQVALSLLELQISKKILCRQISVRKREASCLESLSDLA